MNEQWALPDGSQPVLGQRPLRMYIHVPWCASRCGYCDFNTYVPAAISGTTPADYVDSAVSEIRGWRSAWGDEAPPLHSVFFGGGTPTLLPATQLRRLLEEARSQFGFAAAAEITTEVNPESVDLAYLTELRDAGFNRLSIGMQSSSSAVLRVLDREHTPDGATKVAQLARIAGFKDVSLDLIYGTPGETDELWRKSLSDALSVNPTHVSAYSLIVEPGTRLDRQVRAGLLPRPDDDVLAQRYEIADDLLSAAGFDWYEVSNWARDGHVSRHNLGYWLGDDWVGVGPGAHSHIGDLRWSNVKHPARYTAEVAAGKPPVAGYEVLTPTDVALEHIMLGIRLERGLDYGAFDARQLSVVDEFVAEGLAIRVADEPRFTLTRRGRLLADGIVTRLT